MRKTTQARRLYRRIELFWLAALAMLCLSASAQSAPPASQNPAPKALPTDPKALMLLAAQSNGLAGSEVKPWHMTLSYSLLDDKGNITKSGTIDELWVRRSKYLCKFTDADSTESEYGTEKGLLIAGDEKPQFAQAEIARNEITDPLPDPDKLDQLSFIVSQHVAGTAKLACLNFKDDAGKAFGRTWCLDADKPILRLVGEPQGKQILFNRILRFQNRYIAGDLHLLEQGKQVLTAHLDSLETIPSVDETVFIPPHDAAPPSTGVATISPDVAQGFLLTRVRPIYPPAALAARVSGIVLMQAIIGMDGHIKNLQIISGPALLQQAAVDAVKQWVYRPYLLNGEPIAVKTTINVIFTFGNPSPR